MAAPLTGAEALTRDCDTSRARVAVAAALLTRVEKKPTPYQLVIEARYPCRCVGECKCYDEDRFEWSFPCTTVFEAIALLRTEHGDGLVHGYGSPMDITFVRLSDESGEELFGWSETVRTRWGRRGARELLPAALDGFEDDLTEASS